jgi:putative phosphoesterase
MCTRYHVVAARRLWLQWGMRIALISDLHGNALALDAVLADLKSAGIDQLACLGDVATLGPRPREVLARLQDLGCICILGNHDAFLLDASLIETYTEAPVVRSAVAWCRAQLSVTDLAFVRTFEARRRLELHDDVELLLFHGSPRSHMEDLLVTTPPEVVDGYLDGNVAAVMAGGHTHIQMLRQHRGMLLVNPGSLGMPFLEFVGGRVPRVLAHAEYAVIDASAKGTSVHLRRVELDRYALQAEAKACVDNPISAMLAKEYASA